MIEFSIKQKNFHVVPGNTIIFRRRVQQIVNVNNSKKYDDHVRVHKYSIKLLPMQLTELARRERREKNEGNKTRCMPCASP